MQKWVQKMDDPRMIYRRLGNMQAGDSYAGRRDEAHVQDADQAMRDEIALKLEILLRDFLNSADNLLNGFSHKDSVTWH